MGLIASINNRSVEGRLKANLVFDEVGALGNLKARHFTALSDSYTPRSTDHWTRDEEGGQSSNKIV